MIDFRYHLISIVAVFLALGIGILMGSLVLGENLVDQLERELGGIKERNDDLEASIEELNAQLELDERFAQSAYRHLVASRLQGERVVLFTFEDTDGKVLDEVRAGIQDAGGSVGGVVTATSKLSLDSQPARDELALVLSSSSGDAEELRDELGSALAARAGAAAAPQGADSGANPERAPRGESLDTLLQELQDAEFVELEARDGNELVSGGTDFVIVGGGTGDSPFPVDDYALGLGISLGLDTVPVVVAESSDSTWGLVGAVRDDDEASSVLTTVDQAESISGRVALVLGLQASEEGNVGHYGIGPGAQSIIPEMEQP